LRIVILGDIHGNLEALEAVLRDAEKERPDRFICAGDIVGYGADPGPCVDTIIKLGCDAVAGNHEYAVLGKTNIEYFTHEAIRSVKWTQQHLTDAQLEYLDSLPLVLEEEDFTLTHGTLHSPELFEYIQTLYDAHLSFKELRNRICFLGHSHVPVSFFDTEPVSYTLNPRVELNEKERALVNVGSVGQPRDQDPRAAYAIYDTDEGIVRIKRVEYDIDTAAEKIVFSGLPEFNARRLYDGR